MLTKATDFLKNIKKENLPHVIVCWGEENFYKDSIHTAVVETIFKDVPSQDRTIAVYDDGEKQPVSIDELTTVVNTYPFFSPFNLVVIKNWKAFEEKDKKNQEAIYALLGDLPDYAYILCIMDKVDKRGSVYKKLSKDITFVECTSLKSYALAPWLLDQAAVLNGRLDNGATALICEYMSVTDPVPLLLLKQELEKLAIYAGERKVWTRQDVEVVFADIPEAAFFAISNAIGEHNLDKFLKLLRLQRKQGTYYLPIGAMVTSELRRLTIAKECLVDGEREDQIVSHLGIHPYAAKLIITQARKFSLAALKKALVEMAKINSKMRQEGTRSLERSFERLEEVVVELLGTKL